MYASDARYFEDCLSLRCAAVLPLTALVLLLATSLPVQAGPPYITDDPEPTDTGHWEIYHFGMGTRTFGVTAGQAGMDINYGAYKDLQLTAVIPADFEHGPTSNVGVGDIELAAKYRFLHQAEGDITPDVAFFPRLFLPTANRTFGSGRLEVFLPVWAEKDFGDWSLFGGGGYTINPGLNQHNYWLGGAVLQRTITDQLSLGVEVYHQTSAAVSTAPLTGINLGLTYKLFDHWSLLAAGGPLFGHTGPGASYSFYVSLKADY
ncbi:hypothetical protein [Methylobacterium sp. NEAU K]|uniref:hypothetical protein n=1 Tax=Methylobacterium sp. NEAU K TaxID=3064946 RepID=UPI0027353CDD|nr:hypothetical protein [Methylobacterium sp. NEAU K]MDP4003542.1 hypothetical protein [Methylobacterium sp. NEAU K]